MSVAPIDPRQLRTVLVCDDQVSLREAIQVVLADAPRFEIVAEAFDGDSCLARIQAHRPEVLILDYSMPGGGPHVAAAARRLNPAMHIVVFSGRQEARVQQSMLAAGADQYVVKTGRLGPLLEALDRAFVATAVVI